MKKTVKTLESMRDSRILYDKNLPAFGYALIFIVGVFLVLAIIWSINTPKMYIIQVQGMVTSEESNYVMSTYTGQIDTCNMREGMLVEKGDVLFTVKSTEYDLQEQQLIESKKAYELQIYQNEILVKAIKDDTNYFDESNPDDSLYYHIYEVYKSQITQSTLDTSAYQMYGYTDEQIEAELIRNQGKIDEIYYSAIKSAESTIEQAKLQVVSIDAQLAAINNGQANYKVKATATGVLHMIGNYKSGMVVQTMTTVATITPEKSKPIIEAYISTSDMARIHTGDEVQIVVDGLSQSVYGTISGSVEQIDSNITTQERNGGSTVQVFRILISMDADYVISQSGDKIDITNGMSVVARIQYDKVTYFNYILDKLGFKSK